MSLYLSLAFQGLIHGAIYALVAVGLSMVYGLLRILHIAHAGLFTLGAYLTLVITNATGSFVLALTVAVVVVGVAGVLIYQFCYEPILRQPPYVILIASIGLLIMMQESFRIIFGPYGLSFANPPLQGRLSWAGLSVSAAEITVFIIAIAVFAGLGIFAKFTRFGLACRATVSDPRMASSFGISVSRVRVVTFFVGSVLAALAGAFVGVLDNVVESGMGNVPSYKSLALIVLGGFGDVRGTLVAALCLGVIEAFGTIYFGSYLDRDAIAFVVMFIVLMIKPHGILGGR